MHLSYCARTSSRHVTFAPACMHAHGSHVRWHQGVHLSVCQHAAVEPTFSSADQLILDSELYCRRKCRFSSSADQLNLHSTVVELTKRKRRQTNLEGQRGDDRGRCWCLSVWFGCECLGGHVQDRALRMGGRQCSRLRCCDDQRGKRRCLEYRFVQVCAQQ